jgi:hypothetical protein
VNGLLLNKHRTRPTASSYTAVVWRRRGTELLCKPDKHPKNSQQAEGSNKDIHTHLVKHLHLHHLLARRKVDLAAGSAWRVGPAAPVAHCCIDTINMLLFARFL